MRVTGVSWPETGARREAAALKAGAQFEAVLLNKVLGDLEATFAALSGAGQSATSRSYSHLGMEALTSGLARAGGIGLAKFIARALLDKSGGETNGI
jgi:Rod binding domain-containing protein